jgi:hypothetical protein
MLHDLIINIIDLLKESEKIPRKFSTQSLILYFFSEVRIKVICSGTQGESGADRRGLIEEKKISYFKFNFDL